MEERDLGSLSQNVSNFSEWLQREYLKRRSRNQNYSIRAFAKYLKLEPSTVSQFLSGKRRPSLKFVKKLFIQLEISPLERETVEGSLKKSDQALPKPENYQMVALDAFTVIADWYHYAILELISISDFKYDFSWIANQLEISVTEARQAVER